MIRKDQHPEIHFLPGQALRQRAYDPLIQIFDGADLFLHASLMPHFIRRLHMDIGEIIAARSQRLKSGLHFSFVVGIQPAVGPFYPATSIPAPTAIPLSKSTAEIIIPLFPNFLQERGERCFVPAPQNQQTVRRMKPFRPALLLMG